jgi:hypothetical protein
VREPIRENSAGTQVDLLPNQPFSSASEDDSVPPNGQLYPPPQPDSGIPAWAYLPDSTAVCTGLQPGRCNRRIVRLRFHRDAQQVERQIAVQSVSGTVVGGAPELGYYYVAIGGDGTLATLARALAELRAHPKVERAHTFEVTPAGLDSRLPTVGTHEGTQRSARARKKPRCEPM